MTRPPSSLGGLKPALRPFIRPSRLLAGAAALIFLSGCVTPISDSRQIALDGTVLYGKVNVVPSEAITKERFQSALAKKSCDLYRDHWCTNTDQYEFVSLLLMNTYQGGTRSVGVAVPKSAKVALSDIVVVRFRKFGGAEFLRIASRGERDDCRWTGGGLFGTLTSAGVVCEDYHWRDIAPKFYK
jgi:hypothetical protein